MDKDKVMNEEAAAKFYMGLMQLAIYQRRRGGHISLDELRSLMTSDDSDADDSDADNSDADDGDADDWDNFLEDLSRKMNRAIDKANKGYSDY